MATLESETYREKRDWLSDFLWQWRGSGALTGETAEAILRILEQEPGKTEPWKRPDPQDLLQSLETS